MSYYIYKYEHPNNGIIYVGQSTDNINQRISSHNNSDYDNIDRKYSKLLNESKIYYITLNSKVQMDSVERYLIDKHKPMCNKQYKTSEECNIEMILPEWKVYSHKNFSKVLEDKPKPKSDERIAQWIQNDPMYDSYIENNLFDLISTRDNIRDEKAFKFVRLGWAKINYTIPNNDIYQAMAECLECIRRYISFIEDGKLFINDLLNSTNEDYDDNLINKLSHGYFILNNKGYEIEVTKYGFRGLAHPERYPDNLCLFKKVLKILTEKYDVYFYDGQWSKNELNDRWDNIAYYLFKKIKAMIYSILCYIKANQLESSLPKSINVFVNLGRLFNNPEHIYDKLKDYEFLNRKEQICLTSLRNLILNMEVSKDEPVDTR